MPRTARILAADERRGRTIADTLILGHEQRNARRFNAVGSKGGTFEISLETPRRLHTDDILQLDDGTLVEVVAAAEPLIEARADDLPALMRLAWHLGDRHVAVEVLANRIRVRREPTLEGLLGSLGAKLTMIEAPFDPEGGAYALPHGHDHRHDHARGAHDHQY